MLKNMFQLLTVAALVVLINAECCLHKVPLFSTRAVNLTAKLLATNNGVVMDSLHYFNGHMFIFIYIGEPLQEFKLLVDTASPNFWVPSKNCSYNDAACMFYNKYDSKSSKTYISNNSPSYVKYGYEYDIEEVTSRVSIDLVNFGGCEISNQTFLEATYVKATGFRAEKIDGILGLDTSYVAYDGVRLTPFFNSLMARGLLKPRPVFSIYQNRDASAVVSGELILGDSDPAYYDGEFTYVNVSRKGHWQITIDKIQVEDDILCERCEAIIATGTSYIMGPSRYIARASNRTGKSYTNNNNYTYTVDCDEIIDFPTINFIISGQNFTLTGDDYFFKLKENDTTTCISGFGIDSSRDEDSSWILGNIFLHRYYIEFDRENSRVGFANAKKSVY